MRFIVKQKFFAFGDDFTIKDEMGVDRFLVKGKVFALGDKLRMYTMDGTELFYIEQKLFRLLPEYTIYLKGQPVAVVKKEGDTEAGVYSVDVLQFTPSPKKKDEQEIEEIYDEFTE